MTGIKRHRARASAGEARSAATNPASEQRPIPEEEKRESEAFWDCERSRPRPPRVQVKSARGEALDIGFASQIEGVRLMSAFGTVEPVFATLMLTGLLNAACAAGGEFDINSALAAVTGVGARDETEAMLATQMFATHFAAITLLRRLKGADNIPQQDSAGSLAARLLRTYAMQMEALQRYRGKGQQKVTVEHVHATLAGRRSSAA